MDFSNDLLADYPFSTNGADRLGQSPPFVLTNGDRFQAGMNYRATFLVTAPPLTNGVLYVNGRYEANAHFVGYLGTGPLNGLRYESFTVGFDFYPLPMKRGPSSFNRVENWLESWSGGRYARWFHFDPAVYGTDNLLTGGYYYRWISFSRPGGLLNVDLNNHAFSHEFKNAQVKPGRWHNLICSVDLLQGKVFTMFDGHLLETIELPADFKLAIIGTPEAVSDRLFVFADHSNGSVFFGYAAHLKVFRRALSPSELGSLYSTYADERPSFPRPQRPWLEFLVIAAGAGALAVLYGRTRLRARAKGRQNSGQKADIRVSGTTA